MTHPPRQGPAEPAPTNDARPDRLMVWMVVVLVAVFLAPLVWLPFTSSRRASARADEYRDALALLHAGAHEARTALTDLTDPTADPSALGGLLPTMGNLREGATAVGSSAARPVPFAWPLAPSAPFERLVPIRERLADHSTEADAIVATMFDVLNHRAIFAEVLAVGDLPQTAPSRFARFRADMAATADSQAALLDRLPRNPLLTDHEATIRSAVLRFEAWVDEYVDALFVGNQADIQMLLRELANLRVGLDLGIAATLATVRQDLGNRIDRLIEELDTTLAQLDE